MLILCEVGNPRPCRLVLPSTRTQVLDSRKCFFNKLGCELFKQCPCGLPGNFRSNLLGKTKYLRYSVCYENTGLTATIGEVWIKQIILLGESDYMRANFGVITSP